jgi:hypothetical protein
MNSIMDSEINFLNDYGFNVPNAVKFQEILESEKEIYL